VTVLDMAGLAQKGGAVLSHVQVAATPAALHATRIATGEARLVIGCDAIVSASGDVLSRTQHGVTVAAINSGETPTAEFVRNPEWKFPGTETGAELRESLGAGCEFIDANALALALLGDTIYSNPLLLGFAWQKGWLPLELAHLQRAIELNGVSVEKNQQAFNWGRYVAQHGEAAVRAITKPQGDVQAIVLQMPESLDKVIVAREALLTAYQNAAYAKAYRRAVDRIRVKETELGGGTKLPLTRTVAVNLAKLMAYKDEYEVARLYADPVYLEKLRAQFEGEPGRDYKLNFWLAPPLLAKRDEHGHLVKRRFGPWMLPALRMLARMKGLRGTAFDVFGKTQERRDERRSIAQYVELVDEFCASLDSQRLSAALQLAALPQEIRGFGHVKERNLAAATKKRERLLQAYRAPEARRATA
jgi:indolepyruvate ferredoxin oxidoreductase